MKISLNKKRYLGLSLLLFGLVCLGAFYYFNHPISPRERFEAFLLKKYKEAPSYPKGKKHHKSVDQPDMAAFQDYLMTLDPVTKTVPRDRLYKSFHNIEKMQMLKSAGTALQWKSCPSNMGGRTRTIMYDPNDQEHKKVWSGAVTGGLWYNNNISDVNSSWFPIDDFWPCLSIRCITYDPNNPKIFYVGTGEVETALQIYRESSGVGSGIWKSDDGGKTWEQLSSTSKFSYITDIGVRNENGKSVIYAGVASGLYKETKHKSVPSDGLYRSADGGNTWEQVLPNITGLMTPYTPSDIEISSSGRIFVGSRPNLNGEGGGTIFYSDTGLSGSWNINLTYKTEIETGRFSLPLPGRVMIALAPSNPNIVYAEIASGGTNSSNGFKFYSCYHLLRSNNKGSSWSKMNIPTKFTSGNNFANLAWHALCISVDPNNADKIFIGGLDVNKSTDGGVQWSLISDWSKMYDVAYDPTYVHADIHTFVFKPGSSDEMLIGTDGGVFYTDNATNATPVFKEANKDFNTLQFYTCAMNPTSGVEDYMGGLQDNGSIVYQGKAIERGNMIGTGDGAYCFYDEDNLSFSLMSSYYNSYFLINDNAIKKSIVSWTSGIFINPVDIDYKLDNLYANAMDFNGQRVGQILRIANLVDTPDGAFIDLKSGSRVYFSAVKYSPLSPAGRSTLFVGTQVGQLFKVSNAESTPVTTEIGSPQFPTANISSIAIGTTENELLVTFSNYGVASVWQTIDGGKTWQNKEGNLPDMPVRWAIYHPGNKNQVMLATESGVWTTFDVNSTNVTWAPDIKGMANVRTDMLKVRQSDNTVLAATHGRGLFTAKWDIGTSAYSLPIANVRMYPNPLKDVLFVSFSIATEKDIKLQVVDQSGKVIYEDRQQKTTGQYQKQINLAQQPSGIYFVTIWQNGQKIASEKVVKI